MRSVIGQENAIRFGVCRPPTGAHALDRCERLLRIAAKANMVKAAYHDALHQKYERAAQSLSLPVSPDAPPPEWPKPPHGLEWLDRSRPSD